MRSLVPSLVLICISFQITTSYVGRLFFSVDTLVFQDSGYQWDYVYALRCNGGEWVHAKYFNSLDHSEVLHELIPECDRWMTNDGSCWDWHSMRADGLCRFALMHDPLVVTKLHLTVRIEDPPPVPKKKLLRIIPRIQPKQKPTEYFQVLQLYCKKEARGKWMTNEELEKSDDLVSTSEVHGAEMVEFKYFGLRGCDVVQVKPMKKQNQVLCLRIRDERDMVLYPPQKMEECPLGTPRLKKPSEPEIKVGAHMEEYDELEELEESEMEAFERGYRGGYESALKEVKSRLLNGARN